MTKQWIFAGLGNPGKAYETHRHSIGFYAIEQLRQAFNLPALKTKGRIALSQGDVEGHSILLACPLAYMNVSGQALAPLVHFYKDAKLVVIHDDLDLACGHMRFKQGGGTGGHNGLRDLHRFIGPEYARIRLGIGHPGDKQAVHEYVLSPFSVSERQGVEKSVHTLICAIDLLLTGKEDLFIQTLHQHKA